MFYVYLGAEEREDNKETTREFRLSESHPLADLTAEFVYASDLYEFVRSQDLQSIYGNDYLKEAHMSVYLMEGDVWVNCGTTPPDRNLRFPRWDFFTINTYTGSSELVDCLVNRRFSE